MVSPSRPLPSIITPSEATKEILKASKENFLILIHNLGKNSPYNGHLWGLNPNIWVWPTIPKHKAWEMLNISVHALQLEQDCISAFLRAKGERLL